MTVQISTSAITYAHSLIEADENFDKILSDFQTVNDVIISSKDFELTMNNPSVSLEVKYEILDEVFQKELSKTMMNFIKILIDKNRFNEFGQIMQAYLDEINEIRNIKLVEIVSAIELSKEQKEKITKKLETKLDKTIKPKWQTDKNIIGGLVIKIDDNVIDSSIKNKLDKLSKI